MATEKKIGIREAIAATIYFLSTKLLISFPQHMAEMGETAAWIVIIISFITATVGFLVVMALIRRYPTMNIVEASEEAGGSVLGIIASIGYFSFFFATTVLLIREFSETVSTALLPRTPLSVIMGVFIISTFSAVHMGLGAIAGTALIGMPLITVTLILLNFLLLPQSNFDVIFPLFGPGLRTLISRGISHSGIAGEILFLGVIANNLDGRHKMQSAGLISLAVAGFFMVMSTLTYCAVFPYPLSLHITYPGYESSTLIYMGRFLQRIEVAFVFLWVISACIHIALSGYTAVAIVQNIFKLPSYRPLLPAFAVLAFTFALAPSDIPQAMHVDFMIVKTYGGLVVFVMPLILLLISRLRSFAKADRR
ncbi:MAG: endospore germination permease [Firmicutes bacterium]|jgi:spore germination protein KB|nr:endospore germination permease [Bacillota bacterium]